MNEILGIILFFAGVAFIWFSKRIAKRTSSSYEQNAKLCNIEAISRTKWDSPYMIMIARVGMIIWGVVLILAAYVTIFGTIELTQQPGNSNQINSQNTTTSH
jgi:hypothetical protein